MTSHRGNSHDTDKKSIFMSLGCYFSTGEIFVFNTQLRKMQKLPTHINELFQSLQYIILNRSRIIDLNLG